jgi:hypothetical protein
MSNAAEGRTSYAVEVIADNSGEWVGNGLRFATQSEAEAYACDLAYRWTLVRETRVVACDDAVNSEWTHHLVHLKRGPINDTHVTD